MGSPQETTPERAERLNRPTQFREADSNASNDIDVEFVNYIRKYLPLHIEMSASDEPLRLSLIITGIFSAVLTARSHESFIGDLEQRYNLLAKSKSRPFAQLWLLRQAATSLVPLVIAALKRISGYDKLIERLYRRM